MLLGPVDAAELKVRPVDVVTVHRYTVREQRGRNQHLLEGIVPLAAVKTLTSDGSTNVKWTDDDVIYAENDVRWTSSTGPPGM